MDKNIVRLMELWDKPINEESDLEAKLCAIAVSQPFINESKTNGKVHPEIHSIMLLATPKVMTVMVMAMINMTLQDV